MIFDILETKIETAGLAVAGQDLFRQYMPEEVSIGIMSRVPLQGITVDPNLPGWYKPRLQFIVRHTDPVEGRALADQVVKTLIVQAEERYPATSERGAVKLSIFFPEQVPIEFPRLTGNGIEWSLNFMAAFHIDQDW